MLVLIIQFIKIALQSCTSLAEYTFDSVPLTSVSSTINPSTQPLIEFPGFINSANSVNDPVVLNTGIEISPQKYLEISNKWSQSAYACTEISIWLYYMSGVLGEIAGVALQNMNGVPKYIVLKGEASSLNVYIGGQTITVGTLSHGWNIISFGMCIDFLNTNMCQIKCPEDANNIYIPQIGGYVSTDPLFIGCKTCTDSTADYIIYSLKVSETDISCVFSPLKYAMSNRFYPCGDGILASGEVCDDYNIYYGDGCSETCQIEARYSCYNDSIVLYSKCDLCGNGITIVTEKCDDGNSNSGDGCSSTCQYESNWNCIGSAPTQCSENCGDGIRFNSNIAYCDDGNISNGDGCSSSCAIESGWTCSGGTTTSKDVCIDICGDGKRYSSSSTFCDDGNIVSGDGCSSTCVKETGWKCSGGSASTQDTCTEICGDGIKFNSLTTYCDDANSVSGDGCSLACAVESGWSCTGGGLTTKDTCTEICGDGKRFNSLSTYCDDGNSNNSDGCSNICAIESGWKCSGGTSTKKDTCTEICGDSKRFNILTTYCDDGNIVNKDGCNSVCSVESGWTCSGGNSAAKDTCTEICGDGIRFNTLSSYCDDGNIISNDGCNSGCSVESGYSCSGGSNSTKDTCTDLCGDGKRFNSIATYCDDGNNLNGDGCSSVCAKESGWTCSGGTTTTKDVCTEICGDGRRYNSINTYCDDGNTVSGDGCNSSCAVESDWTCLGGSSTAPDICAETCGDGKRINSIITYCDDGNNSNGDGCSSTCSVESGWTCSGGSLTTADSCTEICGDGKRFNSISTYCDDGNTVSGDGCSATCAVEATWSCTGGSSTTKDTCIELCGDGKRFNTLSTFCDDGNTANNDGCSSTCSIESGWTCTGGSSTTADHCTEVCGDGKRFNSVGTYCDDGNLLNGDGCSSTCTIETGWTCSGGTTATKDVCIEICGDGKKYGSLSTSCDDGNTNNGDGCSMTCSVETGWICSGGSSTSKDTCTEICGDGKRFNIISTYCDDGNTINGDGCSSLCTKETGWTCSGGTSTSKDICNDICGDGKKYTSLSTFCDDGNTVNNDGCNSVCAVESGWTCTGGTSTTKDMCSEICGDAKRFNSIATYCDDGNIISNDGCSSTCQTESGWNCFGGTSTSKDSCSDICGDGKKYNSTSTFCDDGNVLSGDGCSSSCLKETGWTCSGGTTTTADTCVEICGNGIRFNILSTYCDDGNTSSNDGCSSTCTKESGWNCSGGSSTTKDTCTEICGDGKRFNSISTYCDDGNTLNGDGCSTTCSKESGWNCSGGSTNSKDTCTEICGDGIRFNSLTTYCDDGNLINGDGCSSTCGAETGFTCAGGSSTSKDTCYEKCGDGIRYTLLSSYCDDGNTVSGDGCSSTCTEETEWLCIGGSPTSRDVCTEVCGDGIRINTLPTYCDDANNINGDGCSSACGVETGWKCTGGSTTTKDSCSEICGDGIRFNSVSTYCDDKNTNNSDDCSSSCTIESGWLCSGGTSTTVDICSEICGDGKRFNTNSSYCDDGNLINGDGCSSQCKVEWQYTCKGGDSSSFNNCKSYYSASSQENNAALSNKIAVLFAICTASIISIFTASSFIGSFAIINQFQMLLLLITCRIYLSDGVKTTIVDHITFNPIVCVSKLIFMIALFAASHLLLFPIISKLRGCRKESKYKLIGDKMYNFFNFAIYVRMFFEAFLIILLSAASEISLLNLTNITRIISLIVSCILCIVLLIYFVSCWYQIWKAHPDITMTDQTYFIEFFNGLKNNTYARMFPVVFMMQRILCAIPLVIVKNLNPVANIIAIAIIYICSLVYFIIVRPCVELRDLLVEGISQILVVTFTCMLIYFNEESKWSSAISWMFICLILVTNIIIAIITFASGLIKLISKIRSKSQATISPDETRPQVSEIMSKLSKMQEMVRVHGIREEYKIDLSESDPTLVNVNLNLEKISKIQQSIHDRMKL